ncbi:MAG: archease [Bacillota bacterium]|nr:archease [Bacillota bacterium]
MEHTADTGLAAEAEDLPSLFATVAEAVVALLLERPPGRGRARRSLALAAPDLEGLLVRWVDEILFLVQTRGFVPVRCRLEVAGPQQPAESSAPAAGAQPPAGGWRLEGRLAGARLEREAMGFRGEVKAATRHRLYVGRGAGDGRWRARLFLDV